MPFQSLRDYLDHLKSQGQIFVIDRPINKDTELMPLVRCQYRGLDESQRKPFLFNHVTDAKNRSYDSQVLVGALGASKQIYAMAMGCRVEEIKEKWNYAIVHPIEPKFLKNVEAPVHEEVLEGDAVQRVGLDKFPIPISTPGFDPAPFVTCVNWVTKDVDTGIPNIGNYRAMVKGRDKLGMMLGLTQHVGIHWSKQKEKGGPLEAAIIIGGPPAVNFAAVAKVPYGLNEYAVAGGLMGRAVELVPCKTVNLEVPAQAEIVLEGEITTTEMEPEGPFGEFSGFVGDRGLRPHFKIKCITHRRRPIFQAFISQFPPSESTKIRGIANEAAYYDALRNKCNCPFVLDVVFPEMGASGQSLVVVKIKKRLHADPWQALRAAASLDAGFGKIFIAVDEDVDANDFEAIMWALCWRMQPHRDMEVIQARASVLDPSTAPPEIPEHERFYPGVKGNSAVLIDATRKWNYPPVSLPKKEYMERALEIWKEEGLPALTLREPWYGYTLGPWSSEFVEEAEMAVRGDYYETGKKLGERKILIDKV